MENDLTNHRALISWGSDYKEILIVEVSPDGKYVKFRHPVYDWKTWSAVSIVISDLGPGPKKKGLFGF